MREVGLFNATVPLLIAIAYGCILLLITRKSFGVQKFHEFSTSNGVFSTWFITFTIMATWFVGASYTAWMGWAVQLGFIYLYGCIYGVYSMIVLYFCAEMIWNWGKCYELNTQGDLWGLRYNSEKVKILVGIVGVVVSSPWMIIEFWTIGFIINYATYGKIPFSWGMILGVLLIGYYVTNGGMKAVITANFIQGLVFTLGAIVFTFALIRLNTGGVASTFEFAKNNYSELFVYPGPGWNPPAPYWLCITLASALGSYTWPWLVNKVFVSDSVKSIRRASWQVCALTILICFFGFYLYGLSIHQFEFARLNPQETWLWFADKMAGTLGLSIALLVVLSAVLGTVSSLVHCFAVSITNDIILPLNKKMTDEQATRYARHGVIIISIIALVVANFKLPGLVFIALFAYNFIIQLVPGQILGVLWKRGNKYGAVIGFLVGSVIAAVLLSKDISGTGFNGWTPGIIGLFVNFVIYIAFGLLLPIDKKTEELFDKTEEFARNLRKQALIGK